MLYKWILGNLSQSVRVPEANLLNQNYFQRLN